MKIGYVGDSRIHKMQSGRTFRLASYTPEKLHEIIASNLQGLQANIIYSIESDLLFYRVRSDIVPFASHIICKENWQNNFKETFAAIGEFIRKSNMRISMHPDQFVVINSPNSQTVRNSIAELKYHADMQMLLGLNEQHKLQIHVGGVYGDKAASIQRFIENFKTMPEEVQERLVIENDDRLFTVNDCYSIYETIGTPILFDNFHFTLNNNGEDMKTAMKKCFSTWAEKDGVPMTDYSSQQEGQRIGRHSDEIDIEQFKQYYLETRPDDFDIILEIKDKDTSALQAREVVAYYEFAAALKQK